MNTKQTAKLLGVPESILIRMRTRQATSLKSGPPFCKKMGKDGQISYTYNRADVLRWKKLRRCLITAADAAIILSCSRDEILLIYGLTSIEVKSRVLQGKLIIDNGKNTYIWIPNGKDVPPEKV